MKNLIASVVCLAISGAQAFSSTFDWQGREAAVRLGGGSAFLEPLSLTATTGVLDYQVGDSWGKTPIKSLNQAPRYADKIVQATARVGGGTGWFLGYFAGKAIMASNHHVCQSGACMPGRTVKFPINQVSLKVSDYYGSWTDVDLALFAVTIPENLESQFQNIARPFNFDKRIEENLTLMTFGFGIAGNPRNDLMGGFDEDCRVLSSDIVYMPDPDEYNPGPYKVYSFANGCDVSHGDSGSAMVDSTDGEVIGIIWTGKIPKQTNARSSANIRTAQENNDNAFIWGEMSYGAPAVEIKKVLSKAMATTQSNDLKNVLEAMLR